MLYFIVLPLVLRAMGGGGGGLEEGDYSPQMTIQVCATLKSIMFQAIWSGKGYKFCLRSLEKGKFRRGTVDQETFLNLFQDL